MEERNPGLVDLVEFPLLLYCILYSHTRGSFTDKQKHMSNMSLISSRNRDLFISERHISLAPGNKGGNLGVHQM